MHLLDMMALLAVALVFAKLLGGLASKIGIPSVLAELLTGVLIGNLSQYLGGDFAQALMAFEKSEITHAFSELGVLFLLFIVGLETDVKEIGKVGKDATIAAFLGVAAPFALAFAIIPFVMESSFNHTMFIAAALTATSVGITARVLQDTGRLKSPSGQIILGAAVIDDVLGIIVLTVVAALVTKGTVSPSDMGILLSKIAFFGIGVILIRKFFLQHALVRIRPFEVSGTVTILLLSMTLIMAWTAEQAGLAGIIGAFALGIALDDVHFSGFKEKGSYTLEHLMKPITDFFVPIFFIIMGTGVKMDALLRKDALVLAGILIVAALIGKLACGLAVSKKSKKMGADPWLVGFGMVPRGEVGLIFAAMGQKLNIVGPVDYAAIVAMVAVTTLMAPVLIAWRAKRLP